MKNAITHEVIAWASSIILELGIVKNRGIQESRLVAKWTNVNSAGGTMEL